MRVRVISVLLLLFSLGVFLQQQMKVFGNAHSFFAQAIAAAIRISVVKPPLYYKALQQELGITQSSATTSGYLSNEDWQRFNQIANDASSVTILVAAKDSKNKDGADFVADGSDDQIEIQQAIGSLTGPGVVKLLEGTFVFSSFVSLAHEDDGVFIEGSGKNVTTITGALAADVPFFKFLTNAGETLSDIRMRDMTIDGSAHATSNSITTGMIMQDGQGSIEFLELSALRILTAESSNMGISFHNDSGSNRYVRIVDNEILSTGVRNYGIQVRKNIEHLWIEDNYIAFDNSSGLDSYNGIAVYAGTKYFHVNNNTLMIPGKSHTPIAVSPGSYGEIQGNIIHSYKGGGEGAIEVEWHGGHGGTSTSHHILIAHNIIKTANKGIYTRRDGDTSQPPPYTITITGNIISDCITGVHIIEGTDITVYGNTYEGCTTAYVQGETATTEALHIEGTTNVRGGLQWTTDAQKPTCSIEQRGLTWFTAAANGLKDSMEVCAKESDDTYSWRPIW